MATKFKAKKAVREKIYTKIALMAPSGGGKTYTGLVLATGMANELSKVLGRPARILMANTEGARGYYYANEFDYDIIDLEAPFNPEQFVEAIDYAVDEKYDILLMDSTSPEWEGAGGCLELQQKAGGTYQAWKTITPRHDRFINKLATSPIHIIGTMRGKDQYEIEKDDRGKTSIKKLGVGAKQRDGFEYEFTCTFTIDQKTHAAEAQKDNTHIFEDSPAMALTEKHGEEIIKWANESNIDTVKQKFEAKKAEQDTEQGLAEAIKSVIETATLAMKKNKPAVMEILKKAPEGNPNKITDIAVALEIAEELRKVG